MKFLTLTAILIAAVSAHEGHDHAAEGSATASVAATGQAKSATSSIYKSGAKEIASFGAVAAVSVLLL
ncbi:hypothetical protein HDU98_002964 [Podochytrium sp. JEL0797]|nr:hypothetical protein HDU98_002964 [Podochytrium sp. JEL0797]